MTPGELLRRVAYLLNRRAHDAALQAEMDEHRARLDAPARFGNARRLREQSHEAWGWTWLDDVVRDTRLAGRSLRRQPAFTSTVVLSLALGIVLIASTLAVTNAYLGRTLPYAATDRLYNVMYAPPGPWEPGGMSSIDWASVDDVVEFPITAGGETYYVGEGSYAEVARGLKVSHSFVEGLQVRALLGRALDERDWGVDSDSVAMIGYRLWRDRYGSDPSILGRVIRADVESRPGLPETVRVVGVLRPEFYFGRDSSAVVDLMLPLRQPIRTYLVRLRPNVSVAFAEQRITEAARAVATGLPSDWTGVHLDSTRERYIGALRPVLRVVTAGAVFVLVLVWANVAVLTLLRGAHREGELAIRAALGSGRWRLTRMLAIEALVLVSTAMAVGLGIAHVTLGLLAPVIERRLGRPAPGGTAALSVDGTVLLLVGVVGVMLAVSLALLPILASRQRAIGDALSRNRSASGDGRAMRRLRLGLLTAQIAGTFVVLVGGGLLARSTWGMLRTDLGFEPDRMVRSQLVLRSANYADGAAYLDFYDRFAAAASTRLHAPVVFSNWPPFAEFPTQSVEDNSAADVLVRAGLVRVGGGYFGAAGTRLRQGRDLTADDERVDAPVAVVSETLARRTWPDGRALGRQVRAVEATPGGVRAGMWRTVVGVVADVRQGYFDSETADIYVPFSAETRGRYGSFFVRTDMMPANLWPILREVAAGLDRTAVVNEPQRASAGNLELEGARFFSRAMTMAAGGAVWLMMLGVYGVAAYSARQRAREVAVRVALGASPRTVRRLLWRESGTVMVVGIGVGFMTTLAFSRVLERYLYGVPARDLTTLTLACVCLAAAGILATWTTVRRASTANPTAVLKEG